MNMRGMKATVTSCIGGRDDRFAVQVRLASPGRVYFVYKTMQDFNALWTSLETLVRDVKRRRTGPDELKHGVQPSSFLAKWLASVVDHYAFRQIIGDLRAQEKETMSTLNVLLQFLVARSSAVFMERSGSPCDSCTVGRELVQVVREFLQQPVVTKIETTRVGTSKPLSTNQDGRKRSLEEMRPEDGEEQRSTLFPTRSGSERTGKTQKMCGMHEWSMPSVTKVGIVAPVTSRRRVFAEVEF